MAGNVQESEGSHVSGWIALPLLAFLVLQSYIVVVLVLDIEVQPVLPVGREP